MLTVLSQWATLIGVAGSGLLLVRSRPAIRGTTLGPAYGWCLVAAVVWLIAAVVNFLPPGDPAVGQMWYAAAVSALCPWIAVLGSQRPTVKVWSWFVVLPLVAVLLWPVVLCWLPGRSASLLLPAPALIGFALVAAMGLGNYLGTRFTFVSLATGLSLAVLLLSLKQPEADSPGPLVLRAIVCHLLFWSICGARRPWVWSEGDQRTGWDAVWRDFRNTFGTVWANRLLGRLNEQARKENWAVRLMPVGFVSATNGTPHPVGPDEPRVNHTTRWLLRRFVEEEWIKARGVAPDTALTAGQASL